VSKKLWKLPLDVNANVRRTLPKIARAYFKTGDHMFSKDRDWDELHDFRIETKRFRYTLELFSSHYGPGFKDRLEELKQLQDFLGSANDFIVAAGLLKTVDGTDALRAELHDKAGAKLKRARSWWRANMGTDAAQQRWVSYLQRPAARGSAASKPGPTQEAALKSAH
jgi:CHAD domain-containing protein